MKDLVLDYSYNLIFNNIQYSYFVNQSRVFKLLICSFSVIYLFYNIKLYNTRIDYTILLNKLCNTSVVDQKR